MIETLSAASSSPINRSAIFPQSSFFSFWESPVPMRKAWVSYLAWEPLQTVPTGRASIVLGTLVRSWAVLF